MRTFDTATSAYLLNRRDVVARVLVWITARDRETNAPVSIGLWTGLDVQTMVVEGETRTYYGAGEALSIDPIKRAVGMDVQMQTIRISALKPAAQLAIRGYEPRLGTVQIHRAFFDPASRVLAATPILEWEGVIQEAPISTPAAGGEASCTIRAAGQARKLSMATPFARSDQSRRRVVPGDEFFKYATLTGEAGLDDPWSDKDPPGTSRAPSSGATGSVTTPKNNDQR